MTTHFPLNMHHCTYNSDNPTAGPQRFFIFHHLGFSRPDSCTPFPCYTYVFSTIALFRGQGCSEILIFLGFCAPLPDYTHVFSTIALFRGQGCSEILIFLGFCAPLPGYTHVFSTIALFRDQGCSDTKQAASRCEGMRLILRGAAVKRAPAPGGWAPRRCMGGFGMVTRDAASTCLPDNRAVSACKQFRVTHAAERGLPSRPLAPLSCDVLDGGAESSLCRSADGPG